MLAAAALLVLTFAAGTPALDLGPSLFPTGAGGPGRRLHALSLPAPEGGAPACAQDVCQPRVAVPGFDPRFSTHGRTALALSLLKRSRIEPLTSVAGVLAATGLRFDYSPPRASADAAERGGSGRFQVFVRWRLDALNRPVWSEQARRPG